MPEMKHSFQKGRMNKDLDERLVPNGEYRDALNVEVSTTNESDMGSLQTVMGNSVLSTIGISGARCVGSIADDKTDKIYWFIAGTLIDAIAEYDYLTNLVVPVCVDNHGSTGTRSLNFNSNNLITGINVVDDIIFWTDNHSEPKRVNITRGKLGSSTFTSHTNLMVRDVSPGAIPNNYIADGPIEESHLTVIKKGPPTAPVLEMIDTTIGDWDGDGFVGGDELSSPISTSQITFIDPTSGEWNDQPFVISTTNSTDFPPGAFLTIYAVSDNQKKVRVEIQGVGGPYGYTVKIKSGNKEISGETDLMVEIEQSEALFQFKFPRFATRYKYEDGEYSCFSPFTEPAFLPGKFDYVCKEGYNLGMVNNVRKLAIKDFVHGRLLPKDVISIDILYKESNSPNIYSIKTVKRINNPLEWDSWNAISPVNLASPYSPMGVNNDATKGYFLIKSEMIHAMLPANQLLRPWDNVPRTALGQEVVGNRLVYGNYLQNYNLRNINTSESTIKPEMKIEVDSWEVGDRSPEEIYTGWDNGTGWSSTAFKYSIAKSVKTLRTYQIGVVYIDEYGRETPVFSEDKQGSTGANPTSEASVYVDKTVAHLRNSLKVSLKNNPPDWATHFKFFIKETSNEYYNLAMDRFYDAEDGNVWISFPSAERNKVDEDTFLILKKKHDSDMHVLGPSRYKIIAIENEAPRFIKLQNVSMGGLTDGDSTGGSGPSDIIGIGADGFPMVDGFYIYVETEQFIAAGWNDSLVHQDISQVFIRVKSGGGISLYYRLKQITIENSGYHRLECDKQFGTDMSHTSPDGTWLNRIQNCELQIVKKIPEDRAEFEGRFFVKILKDGPLEDYLNMSFDSTLDYVTINSMVVQYIAPEETWARTSGNFYGQNRLRLSVDKKADDYYAVPSGCYSGDGQDFWKFAADDDANEDSVSSGWFIDKVEAFRPWTGSNGGKRIGKRQESFNPSWSCMSGAAGFYDQYNSNIPPKMVNVLGVDTYNYPSTSSSYLGMSGLRGPGNKVATADLNDGGRVAPSQGIDETNSTITLSYAGMNLDNNNSNGNYSSTTWGSLDDGFSFSQTMQKHVNDEAFISKLMTPGTMWRWKEDPGKVLYKTVGNTTLTTSTTPFTSAQWNREQLDHDGEKGVILYNYALFSDYMIKPHHEECMRYACFGTQTNCDTKVDWVSRNIGNSSPWVYCLCFCFPATWAIVAAYCSVARHSASAAADWGWAAGWVWNNPHRNFPTGVYDWNIAKNRRRRFSFKAEAVNVSGVVTTDANGDPLGVGKVGPHFYLPTNDPTLPSHFDSTATAITTYPTGHPQAGDPFEEKAPGIRQDGMYTGYDYPGSNWSWNPGDGNGMTTESVIPQYKRWDASSPPIETPIPGSVTWEIVEAFSPDENNYSSTNPAIWETEPKEDVGLDIYHEVGQIYPIHLNKNTIEQFVGAIHLNSLRNSHVLNWHSTTGWHQLSAPGMRDIRVWDAIDNYVALTAHGEDIFGNPISTVLNQNNTTHQIPTTGSIMIFVRADGSTTEAHVGSGVMQAGNKTYFELEGDSGEVGVHNEQVRLPWFNCYSFGNGVESDRIRDDYNQVTIDNGPKASTTIEEPYLEERRKNGFIWSGLYNSTSGVNNLNQFIQAEKITKDVNPTYGSIQKLHVRDSDLVAFCEDRVLKVLANKDALYNADGNTNLVSTDRVLGNIKPFVGDFGISQNPESFASDSYRSYFSDTSRGAIIRLSMNGLTAISDIGMKEWFADNLINYSKTDNGEIIGSFDNKKEEYNITLMNLNPYSINGGDTSDDSGGDTGDYSGGSSDPIDFVDTNILGYWNYNFGAISTIGNGGFGVYDNNGNQSSGGGVEDQVTQIVIPIGDMYNGNMTSNFQQLIDAFNACPNGTVNLYYQVQGGNPGEHAPNTYSDTGAPILTYTINSITTNTDGNYNINVTYVSGNGSPIDIAYIWWSADCDSVVNGGDGDDDDAYPCGPNSGEPTGPPQSLTLTYNEPSKGWVSFKSFLQENGVSLNNSYYTFKSGDLWEHHASETRNNFYNTQYDSSVLVLFNQMPGSIKSFTTLNYEGSQARITPDINTNPNYYDNVVKTGWYVDSMISNAQEVGELEFWDKEDKWFSQIKGVKTEWLNDGTAGNIDPREFSYQGIGNATSVTCPDCPEVVSWNCDEEGNCYSIPGGSGTYPNEQECIDCCSGVGESWKCVPGAGCIDPGDGSGIWSSFCECVVKDLCCENGEDYFFTCQNLTAVAPVITGCMDDGITLDPFIIQNRPNGWIGAATNYDPNAVIDNCDCIYLTETSWDCIECNCVDIGGPGGQYSTESACNNECCANEDPCDGQNMGMDLMVTNPTEAAGSQNCDLVNSDGSVSITVTNNNATSPDPFTSWSVEYYEATWPTTGSPVVGPLVYSDPNIYATGSWSNTYVGLTTANGGTENYNVYYAIITDNFGCQYGPFVIRINCIGVDNGGDDPCVDYPGDNGCCEKCNEPPSEWGECAGWCQEWGDCCVDCVDVTQAGDPCAPYPTNPNSTAGSVWNTSLTYGPAAVVSYGGNYYTLAVGVNNSTLGVWISSEWNACCTCSDGYVCDLSTATPWDPANNNLYSQFGAVVEYLGSFYYMIPNNNPSSNGIPGSDDTRWILCCDTTGEYDPPDPNSGFAVCPLLDQTVDPNYIYDSAAGTVTFHYDLTYPNGCTSNNCPPYQPGMGHDVYYYAIELDVNGTILTPLNYLIPVTSFTPDPSGIGTVVITGLPVGVPTQPTLWHFVPGGEESGLSHGCTIPINYDAN